MPNLLNESDSSDLIARIEVLKESNISQWGKMNVNQMLCHCADGLRMALGVLPVKDKSNIITRTLLRWYVFRMKELPKSAPTIDEMNQEKALSTKPTSFESDKKELIELIRRFQKANAETVIPASPVFGKMSKEEWGWLNYMNIDHHLKQFSG